MDGDGDMDIVSASHDDNTIAWYENNGAADPTWTATDIATSRDGANFVYVADMDGDGDMDIISTSALDDTVAWYENDPDIDDILTDGNGNLLSLTTSLTYQSTTKTITANLGVGAVDFTSTGNGKWDYMQPSSLAGYNYGQYLRNGFYRSRINTQTQQALLEFNDGRSAQAGYTYIGAYNGHSYFRSNSSVEWENQRNTAIAIGGYLANITSAGEREYLNSVLPNCWYRVGHYQDVNAPEFSEPAGGWKWLDGKKEENLTFSRFHAKLWILQLKDPQFGMNPIESQNFQLT